MKKFLFLSIIVICLIIFTFYLVMANEASKEEDKLQLPNKDFQEITFYRDNLSDSNGMRAFPWGIEIWEDPLGTGNEMPTSYFEKGQVCLIGHSLNDVVVLAIPDPPNKPKVKEGLKYIQSFEVKLEKVEGMGVRIIHQWFDSGDSFHQIIDTQYGNFEKGTSDWHTISLIGTAPEGAQKGDIIIEFWGTGTIYIRNPRYHLATLLDIIHQLSLKQVILWILVALIIFLIITEAISLISLFVVSLKEIKIKKVELLVVVLMLFSTFSVVKMPQNIQNINNQETIPVFQEEPSETTVENNNLLEFRGVDFFPRPNSYSSTAARKSLKELLEIPEINYIQLRFFLFQENLESSEVSPYQHQEKILTELIQEIHTKGKKVSLMPHIYTTTNLYVANINPQDKEKWFASYTKSLLIFAQLAEKEKVELFSIGNELTNIMKEESWSNVIDSVREVYKGKLTIKLNCWYKKWQFENILNWQWLNKLDYIGIAAYFDLTATNDPSLEDLKQAWLYSRQKITIVADLEKIAETFNKPILFSEIGYRNIDGTNIEPWNSEALPPQSIKELRTGKEDTGEALMCIEVLFETFRKFDWFKGTMWFLWPTASTSPNDVSFSIRNKPLILKEIIEHYSEGD